MDSTIVAAIISALGAIIAGLGGALIGVLVNGSRQRRDQELVTQAAKEVMERVSADQDRIARVAGGVSRQAPGARGIGELAEELAFRNEILGVLGSATASPLHRLKPGEITLSPEENQLALVVQKDNPRAAFNMLTRLTNSGHQVGIVDGLSATLTGPEGVTFRFVWHLFYGYQRDRLLHTMSSYIHPVAIPPESSRVLGIQFVGPDLGIENLYSWPAGRYQCEITGWVNRNPDDQPSNLSSKFYLDISPGDIAQLKEWIGWSDEDWARFPSPDFPDPDKAAGLPVGIIRA